MATKSYFLQATAPAAYAAAGSPTFGPFGFTARSIILCHIGSADAVTYSFDGVTDHGRLVPNTPTAGIKSDRQHDRVWIKGANSPVVTCHAED